jgi:hypothetical protein
MDIIRSHTFTVHVGTTKLPIMKVAGLAPSHQNSESYIKMTRAVGPINTQYTYFTDWFKERDRREVFIELKESVGIGMLITLMDFRFDARATSHYYSELDAGSNQIFTETIQLHTSNMEIRNYFNREV